MSSYSSSEKETEKVGQKWDLLIETERDEKQIVIKVFDNK